jgi:hypothetical protein
VSGGGGRGVVPSLDDALLRLRSIVGVRTGTAHRVYVWSEVNHRTACHLGL